MTIEEENVPIKHTLRILRYWNDPEIKISINQNGIQLDIGIEDFCKAMAAEMKHPMTIFTRVTFEKEILLCLPGVLEKIKETSVHT